MRERQGNLIKRLFSYSELIISKLVHKFKGVFPEKYRKHTLYIVYFTILYSTVLRFGVGPDLIITWILLFCFAADVKVSTVFFCAWLLAKIDASTGMLYLPNNSDTMPAHLLIFLYF